jgi:hypothetical protein
VYRQRRKKPKLAYFMLETSSRSRARRSNIFMMMRNAWTQMAAASS